jgi:hypothetical protein
MKKNIIWRPQQGAQEALMDCTVSTIFFGGARGGGKTDGILGKWAVKSELYGSDFNAVFFRHALPMLDDAIERSHQIYGQMGAVWNEQKKLWRLRNGGRIRFRPLERLQDAEKYQGQNITDIAVDEVGNYPTSAPIDRLNGVLRSGAGVPTQMILTGNAGGAGQLWLKARYVDPFPMGFNIIYTVLPNGDSVDSVYMPSLITSNKILLANDPDYIKRLYLVGSEALVKAWLDGDWSTVEGAFFDTWSDKDHIVAPFEIPKHWTRIRSFDWGSARPFSVGWWAVASDDVVINGRWIKRGCMVRYREWYGVQHLPNGQVVPNKGLKLTSEQVGAGIWEREKGDGKIHDYVADPAIFTQDGGKSVFERMYEGSGKRVMFRRADNKRVSTSGALGGWDQMRERLRLKDCGEYGKLPDTLIFSTCKDFIRTVPVLQHDITRPEDLDTSAEDHAADEARYGLMSRPLIRHVSKGDKPIRGMNSMNIEQLYSRTNERKQSNRI